MFTLLSNPKQIHLLCNDFSNQEVDTLCNNMALIVTALSLDVNQLLDNRRTHNALITQAENIKVDVSEDELYQMGLAKILSNHDYLVQAINTLCLTEAIIVRDNFSNCIETLSLSNLKTNTLTSASTNTDNNKQLQHTIFSKIEDNPVPKSVSKIKSSIENSAENASNSNVSSIHLAQIKQRLANAALESEHKKEQVKNKLNGLLATATSITSKHA
ncbi:hypothetical protein [Colwellia echini]|uniref:Uncharacterized protein n=1 Tax=Colwellia echini TaxID=1982103 RepID=A0ABY3MXV7_9GAMM|nr:hypothetical protein [Colwellia echini]TYK65842.1 hypothetical protein CWS31_007775 [Colwellia echini]